MSRINYQKSLRTFWLLASFNCPLICSNTGVNIDLREKRLREKRVYFLVYDDLQAVLIVALSGKKDQQATINHLIKYFDEYRIYLEKQLKN